MATVEAERPTYAEAVVALSAGASDFGLTEPRPLKLTVDDLVMLDRYWKDDLHKSTELIDGRVYFTPARYASRCRVAGEVWKRLREAATLAAPSLFVGTRGSIEVSRYDLPIPDIVLTSEARGKGFIPVGSVPLVVEVVDTALDFYMGEKLRLYARGRIAEYWIVDVSRRSINCMWGPNEDEYHGFDKIAFGERCRSVCLSNVDIETDLL